MLRTQLSEATTCLTTWKVRKQGSVLTGQCSFMDRLVWSLAADFCRKRRQDLNMAWQVEAESMSEADLAKIFRHMLLGVSHTHADVSVQRASAYAL